MTPSSLAALAVKTQTDQRLITLTGEGYEAAFEELVRRHWASLVGHAATMVGPALAEDLVQHSLVSALRSLRTRQQRIENPRAWLHRICHNHSLNQIRLSREHLALDDELDASPEAGPETLVEQREAVAAAVTAMRSLPERQRVGLAMQAFEGLSYEEIAGRLDASESAVRSLLVRAREGLRLALGGLLPLPLIGYVLGGSGSAAGATGAAGAGAGAGAGGGAAGAGAGAAGAAGAAGGASGLAATVAGSLTLKVGAGVVAGALAAGAAGVGGGAGASSVFEGSQPDRTAATDQTRASEALSSGGSLPPDVGRIGGAPPAVDRVGAAGAGDGATVAAGGGGGGGGGGETDVAAGFAAGGEHGHPVEPGPEPNGGGEPVVEDPPPDEEPVRPGEKGPIKPEPGPEPTPEPAPNDGVPDVREPDPVRPDPVRPDPVKPDRGVPKPSGENLSSNADA